MISWKIYFRFIFIYIFILFFNFHQIICDNSDKDNEDISRIPVTKSCPFSGTRYPLGESWFRRLDTHDMSYCVACNCLQGGKSNCTSKPCDGIIKLCEEATDLNDLEKGCCQQCTETDETKRVEIVMKSRMGTIGMSVSTGKPITHKISCLHNGKVYYENQIFASNTSAIHKTQANQCVQCICQAGLVLCRLKTCYAESCTSIGDSDGFNEDCCPLRANCREKPISDSDNYIRKEGHLVTIYSPNDDSSGTDQRFTANDCKSGDKVYANGAKWHPIIGPFGQMDCVICVCNSGSVECSRISCPSLHKSSCLKHIPIQGQCCPTCAQQTNENNKKISFEKELQTNQSFIETNDKSNKSENNAKQQKEWNRKRDQNFNTICVPLRMDTIVYRSHAQSSSSAYYQYAFQTKATNRSTTLFSFTVKDGQIADFSQQHLNSNEYNVLSQSFKFTLLGSTKSKFVDKFAKRTKKFPQRCSHRCKTRVERLERSLRIKEVLTDTLCDKNTFDFY